MIKIIKYLFFLLIVMVLLSSSTTSDWGFFGHRLINRMAVFTLPSEMLPLFKSNIEYLTEHAVDPDKRRYATKHEAVRHYIDIDHWGTYPFANVPRRFTDALAVFSDIVVLHEGDSITFISDWNEGLDVITFDKYENGDKSDRISLDYRMYVSYFGRHIRPQYYEDLWVGQPDTLNDLFDLGIPNNSTVNFNDRLSSYGILPYNLLIEYHRLVKAFKSRDEESIIQLSANIGHYIGDAHVPLHTTENYNGYMTDQVGIHAFWESRLPELYANSTYDFFVGKAEKIDHPQTYFWDMVLESHVLVDSVLQLESIVKANMPEDLIYCFEDRLNRNVLLQCEEFSHNYHQALDGMVENRMRESILSIGSVWKSAWIAAGTPNLDDLSLPVAEDEEENSALENAYREGASKGRKHE